MDIMDENETKIRITKAIYITMIDMMDYLY